MVRADRPLGTYAHPHRAPQARRELGVILIGQRQLGNTLPLELVIPRVQRDGQAAQFRPKALGESMLQQYKQGRTKHLVVLKGLAHLVPGGRVQLKFRGGDHSAVVFEALPVAFLSPCIIPIIACACDWLFLSFLFELSSISIAAWMRSGSPLCTARSCSFCASDSSCLARSRNSFARVACI